MHRLKTRTSYADLLDLYLQKPDDLHAIAKTLGFKKTKPENRWDQDKKAQQSSAKSSHLPVEDDTQNLVLETSLEDRPDLPFYHVVKRERTQEHINTQPQGIPRWLKEAEPLQDDESYDDQAAPPAWQALTRSPRLWAKLRQLLNQRYSTEEPDIPRLVKHIERGDLLRQFPYTDKNRRISQLLILSDYADHLRTVRQDYHQLYQSLIAYWGKSKVRWQGIVDNPGGKVSQFRQNRYHEQKWQIPAIDTAVIILSDCGMLGDQETIPQWQTLLTQLKQAGNTVLVLAPVSVPELQRINFKGIHAYSWDRNLSRASSVYSPKKHPTSVDAEKDVEKLLSCLAFTYRIEPRLLRTIRQLLNQSVECEALCRKHKDVLDDGEFLYIEKKALEKYRGQFSLLETEEQDKVIDLVSACHAYLPRSILDYELTTVQALRPEQAVKGAKESLQNLQRLAKTFMNKASDRTFQSWVYSHLQEQEVGGELAAALFSTLYKKAIEEEGDVTDIQLPKNVSPQEISRFIDLSQAVKPCGIFQQADRLVLDEAGSGKNSISQYQFTIATTQSSLRIPVLKSQGIFLTSEKTGEKNIPVPTEANSITLDTGTENLTLASLTKPAWADTIGRDPQGLFIETEHLGQPVRVYYPEWGGVLGKDEYGVFTEIEINRVVQRFRYIPAGRFMMGSAANEKQRYKDETLHEVTLSQAYWLADTACTQELWQVVMGENPANFKDDPQNPVEQVSREDSQRFIEKLNTLIPQLQAQLPSEAQWEYACRAGTRTPFSFGENITPEQVNYDGSYPYADGKKGKDRNKTVPVKGLPGNPWGLYQMHGNVYEWCQDGYGDYPVGPVQDPQGVEQGGYRVLRGGSWIGNGRNVRSAYRFRDAPGPRNSILGLRFSLGQASGWAVAQK